MTRSLAMKLRVLRAERQLSLREASAVTGVDKVSLSRFERGLAHPQDRTLAKIAQGYGVPFEELLEEPVLSGKAEAPQESGHTAERGALDERETQGWLASLTQEERAVVAEYVLRTAAGWTREADSPHGTSKGIQRARQLIADQSEDNVRADLTRGYPFLVAQIVSSAAKNEEEAENLFRTLQAEAFGEIA